MDALPAILIFVPIIQPVADQVGIHPVYLGAVVAMTLALGLLTRPTASARSPHVPSPEYRSHGYCGSS